jgi:hypothetical protein
MQQQGVWIEDALMTPAPTRYSAALMKWLEGQLPSEKDRLASQQHRHTHLQQRRHGPRLQEPRQQHQTPAQQRQAGGRQPQYIDHRRHPQGQQQQLQGKACLYDQLVRSAGAEALGPGGRLQEGLQQPAVPHTRRHQQASCVYEHVEVRVGEGEDRGGGRGTRQRTKQEQHRSVTKEVCCLSATTKARSLKACLQHFTTAPDALHGSG